MVSGWKGESKRHGLAAKGIKTGSRIAGYKYPKNSTKEKDIAKEFNQLAEEFNLGSDGPNDWDNNRQKLKNKWNGLNSEQKREAFPKLDDEALWLLGFPNAKDDPKDTKVLVYGVNRIICRSPEHERSELKLIRNSGYEGTVEVYKNGKLEGMY